NAPDWNISRNRYWGSPVPVWDCECGERFVPASIKELEEKSGKKIINLHKPAIDEITVPCAKCGKEVHRVPEVLDSWIEAGSASFAERHYPFEKKQPKLDSFFPPDFIAEYTGQIRAWFYVLHVIANVLDLRKDGQNMLSRNVLVEGVILGTDGRKMSKNFKNYPDPKEMLQKYGGDALRLYLLGSPVMHGEDILISEEHYRQQVRGTMLILWNVYNFFVTYALLDKWDPKLQWSEGVSLHILDEWILVLLSHLVKNVTKSLDGYDTVGAIESLKSFVTDFSTWYLRRSRDRVGPTAENKNDKEAFYRTTYQVLTTVCQLFAPITPFIAEAIYTNLTNEESVHLSAWPSYTYEPEDNPDLVAEMILVRKIVEIALSQRKEAQIKVRQPLATLTITHEKVLPEALAQLIKDEVNVKNIKEIQGDFSVELDTKTITAELQAEGDARGIVRMIQEERKKLGTSLDEKVDVTLETWPEEFADYIKKNALVHKLTKGKFALKRLNS
ncbi:MAG TPA: class I tRNA ligase family protein, partial [Patescibacteria group bacterium]